MPGKEWRFSELWAGEIVTAETAGLRGLTSSFNQWPCFQVTVKTEVAAFLCALAKVYRASPNTIAAYRSDLRGF